MSTRKFDDAFPLDAIRQGDFALALTLTGKSALDGQLRCLILFAYRGDAADALALAERLIEIGVDVNYMNEEEKRYGGPSFLTRAIQLKRWGLAMLLLNAGATVGWTKPERFNHPGMWPMQMCCHHVTSGSDDVQPLHILRELIRRGARADPSVLAIAINRRHVGCLSMLLGRLTPGAEVWFSKYGIRCLFAEAFGAVSAVHRQTICEYTIARLFHYIPSKAEISRYMYALNAFRTRQKGRDNPIWNPIFRQLARNAYQPTSNRHADMAAAGALARCIVFENRWSILRIQRLVIHGRAWVIPGAGAVGDVIARGPWCKGQNGEACWRIVMSFL